MSKEFFSDFKDGISSAVQRRGALQPAWDDVLAVSTDTHETRGVLSDLGVSSGGLRRDLLYSLHFGRPELTLPTVDTTSYRDVFSQASRQLVNDIRDFSESQELLTDSTYRDATIEILQYLQNYLTDKERILNDPQGLEAAQMKAKVLGATLTGFVEQFTPTFSEAGLPAVPAQMEPMMREVNRAFTADVLEQFSRFAIEKGKVIATPDQPLLILNTQDEIETAHGGSITPYQIVDTVRKTADPFLQYLLYRNGLVAPDDYEPPCKMPSPTIIEHGLEAWDYAHDIRERAVKPAHLLPSLLEDPNVLRVIIELDEEGKISEKEEPDPFMMMFGSRKGGRNFIKFHAAVNEALAPQKEGERFRYQVKATDEIRLFLGEADSLIQEGHDSFAEAKMLGALIAKDPQTKEVLIKAGLTEEQLQKWPEALQTLEKKFEEERQRKPGEKEKGKEEDFKVSDLELNDLLEEYTVDLSKLALDGKVDPVIGRNNELSQMMMILLQRGRSNPLLLAEPGVGKTTLFYGLAQMIASGKAPKDLLGAKVLMLDLSEMNSNAMYRGQFEGRLLPIIQGVAERNARGDKPPVILCIDELHSALMAGTAQGTPGAGELLKRHLTRGELKIIGATTQSHYAEHIAVDTALDRRFQTIFLDEPGPEDTLEILKGLKDSYTSHHKIEIDDATLESIVQMASRYLPNQMQPDKSIVVMDSTLARARMHEKSIVERADLIETIAQEAKIDAEFLQEGEEERFLRLREELPRQVLGQDHATIQIADYLITAKADLQDPRKPLGVFILMGPTGVGKTETARALSRLLHGSEDNLIRIDMSDFKERHEASRLVGAPPGYVGYGEEGTLTGAVRRRPYSIVDLDEIEEADEEVFTRFLPVFEEGELTDGRGRKISFRNTVLIMTTNLGSVNAVKQAESWGLDPYHDSAKWREVTEPIYEAAVKAHFPPKFLNRVDGLIAYHPLSKEVVDGLVNIEVDKLSERIRRKYGPSLAISDNVRGMLAQQGYSPEYGARELKRVVNRMLTQPLGRWVLQSRADLVSKGIIEVRDLGSNFNANMTLLPETAALG